MTVRVGNGPEATQRVLTDGPATAACNMISYHLPSHVSTPPPSDHRLTSILRVDGYDILDRLGAGGMGVVFKARHRQLNRIVALKMLGRDSLADPESHRRFQSEAEAVARLQHPNIIQVFDVGTFSEREGDPRPSPYLSLEYVDGGSVYKLTLSPQDPSYAARLIEKVARAVHAAHQVGVVHRDLKPANVLLTGEGEPKIADFGLAKQLDHQRDERGGFLTQDGMAVGTPEYMAPEQVDGEQPTPAFDIYAIGVMLYELLTARQPFKGVTLTETMLLVKYQDPVPPSRLRPSLPKDLETICLKCLAKSATNRYATAEELAEDLARYLAGRPIVARQVSRVERLGRWAKRNPSLATLSALALTLAVAGVSGVTWKWREAEWHARLAEAKAQEAEDRRQAERWVLYRASVAVVAADLRMNTLSSTETELYRAPEELRGWEWRHFRSQLDVARAVYRVPVEEVFGLAARSRDRLCLSTSDGLWVWNPAERKHLCTISKPGVWGISPDNTGYLKKVDARTFAYCSFAGSATEVRMTEDDEVVGFNFSTDGRRLLTVTRKSSRVWDTLTGKLVGLEHTNLSPPAGGPGLGGLSADGKLAALNYTISGDTEIWEVDTGRVRCTIRDLQNLHLVRFNLDGTRLFVNEAYPSSKITFWDTTTGHLAAELKGHTNNILDQVYSPDGTCIATCGLDHTVRLWDAASGRLLFTLRGHTSRVNAVAFSPDGTRLVSASDDRTLRLWQTTSGQELGVLRGHTGKVTGAMFVDADTVASVAADQTLRYWDARPVTGSGLWAGHTGFVYSAAYHSDGRHVVSGAWDGSLRVWNREGEEVRRFELPEQQRACGVALDPTGKWVASISWGDDVHLWDFNTGKKLHTWDRKQQHWKTGRLAFHPTADLLACGGGEGAVYLYNPETFATVEVLRIDGCDAVRDVTFSPDGRWLVAAGDSDNTVHVWEVATRKKVVEFKKHTDAVYSLAFSPDGRTLASGSMDGSVQLWNVPTWEWAGKLPHGVIVHGVAFTPDGTRLACGCADSTIRLWDTTRHEQVAELRGHTDYVHALAFSPNGHRLVTASGDMTLRIWDAPPVVKAE